MARYNTKSTGTKTTNFENAPAFSETPELELVSLLLTSFVQDKFYESANNQLKRLAALVKVNDNKFAAQAAIYARTQFGMRSITHALIGELAHKVKGEEWFKNAIDKAVFRVDDITEIFSYYFSRYGKPIPNSLKKGLSQALNKFDEYQIAKYKSAGKSVKLVDVFNMIHPKPIDDKQAEVFKKLIAGELASTETWEAKLSEAGKAESEEAVADNKKQAWKDLLTNKKLGYFALLRNVRNIATQAKEAIPEMLIALVDEKAIKKSLVFPFRFLTAITELQDSGAVDKIILNTLALAMDISVSNVPVYDGKTAILLDKSGSMGNQNSIKDVKSPITCGSLFVAALYKANDSDIFLFDTNVFQMNFVTIGSVYNTFSAIFQAATKNMGGTNLNRAILALNKKYDRIIILSDMQNWVQGNVPTRELADYKRKFNPEVKVYSFDLNGYGTLQFPEKNVYALAGYSDKVFDLMKLLESDRNAMINEIKKVKI